MSTECPCPGSLQTPWLIRLEHSREGIPQDLKPPFRGVRGWLGSAGGTDWGGGRGIKAPPAAGLSFGCAFTGLGVLCAVTGTQQGLRSWACPGPALRQKLPRSELGCRTQVLGVGLAGESRGRAPEKGGGSWGTSSQRGHGRGNPGSVCSPGLCPLPSSQSAQLSQCPAALPALVQAAWGGSVTPRTAPAWTGRGVSVITWV